MFLLLLVEFVDAVVVVVVVTASVVTVVADFSFLFAVAWLVFCSRF